MVQLGDIRPDAVRAPCHERRQRIDVGPGSGEVSHGKGVTHVVARQLRNIDERPLLTRSTVATLNK